MEALISQFTLLSDQALCDKTFDPSTIEDLMKLFELESYKAWAAAELELDEAVDEAEESMRLAEGELESALESAMDEFRRFEEEMERMAREEERDLVEKAEKARLAGSIAEKVANLAAKRYIEGAMNSAAATMRSAWKGIASRKVHPS